MSDEEAAFLGSGGNPQFWCSHADTITDDEHHSICSRCGATFYTGPLREQDLWDFADKIWAEGYERQSGLPPSFMRRLSEESNE